MIRRVLLSVAAVCVPLGAVAQTDPAALQRRLDALESQLHAVQRKVFPGGGGKFFEPEFPTTPEGPDTGTPHGSAAPPVDQVSGGSVSEITARLQTLEQQIADITGRLEQTENRLKTQEDALRLFKEDVEFRLGNAPPKIPLVEPKPAGAPDAASLPARTDSDKPLPEKAPASVPPAAKSADSIYQTGYAAYQAKRYDEAVMQFEDFVRKNPKHALAPQAFYWQGKAYGAKKQYAFAARSYLRGYDRYRTSDKAEDNLIGLAESLTTLERYDQACQALGEYKAVFKTPSAANKTKVAALRKSAKCP